MEKILVALTKKDSTGILVAGDAIGLSFANEYICELLGYTKEELLNFHHMIFLMDQDDPEGHIETYLSIIGGEQRKTQFTHNFLRKDGSVFQADLEMTNHKDSAGDKITVMQFDNIIDSNDRVTQKEDGNLMKISDQFVTNKDTGVLLATTKVGIVYANKLSYESFGYKKNEMYGINKPHIWVHANNTSELFKNSIKVFAGFKSEVKFSCRFVKKTHGTFNANVTIKKHKDGGVKYLVLQLNNIEQEVEDFCCKLMSVINPRITSDLR